MTETETTDRAAPEPVSNGGPVVSLQGVSRSFGKLQALADVDLDIPGGPVGLLGPNGAGKSTMLKILLGLLKPTSGRATVMDVDPAREPVEARRRVGYMPEVDSYITGVTAVDAVALAGVLSGLDKTSSLQRAHTVLNYVGLEEVRYRKVEEYSTGMRQRVRLAQALVHDPDLLFLDEPTNGLDPDGRDEILEIIRDLSGSHGKNVVLCSHLLKDVESTCDHVVLLLGGRVRKQGTMDEIRGGDQGLFRVRVRGGNAAAAEALQAAGCGVEPAEGYLSVSVPEGEDTGLLFRCALESGFDLRSVIPDELTLEDAFVAAVDEDRA
ncbi:MAG: ABC transporter ATP-binding protein [Planctomycetota bacterium]